MKIRFQADSDFTQAIIDGLVRAEPLVDFRSADEDHLRGLADNRVLAISAADDRILVSHDRRTMPEHFAKFIESSDCPGVFIISQRLPVKNAIDELLLIWSTSENEEWKNLIIDIPL